MVIALFIWTTGHLTRQPHWLFIDSRRYLTNTEEIWAAKQIIKSHRPSCLFLTPLKIQNHIFEKRIYRFWTHPRVQVDFSFIGSKKKKKKKLSKKLLTKRLSLLVKPLPPTGPELHCSSDCNENKKPVAPVFPFELFCKLLDFKK